MRMPPPVDKSSLFLKNLLKKVIATFDSGRSNDFDNLLEDLETCVNIIEAWERIKEQLDDLPLLSTVARWTRC